MKKCGPGPGKYMMPSSVCYNGHDYTKYRNPNWSIGMRKMLGARSDGPGPGKFNIERLTRFGTKSYKTYMGIRLHDQKGDIGPGPNKYDLPSLIGKDRTKVYLSKSPDFVMGQRLKGLNNDRVPGPNTYLLPECFGKNSKNIYPNKKPAYSLRYRTKDNIEQTSPGPAKYYPIIKECRFGIQIKGRYNSVEKSVGPGPSKYNLQGYRPKFRDPAYSMGMRLNGIALPCVIEGDN